MDQDVGLYVGVKQATDSRWPSPVHWIRNFFESLCYQN